MDKVNHIVDLNERHRLALAKIDKAFFGWYHIRAVIVAGVGFFTDAYDLFLPLLAVREISSHLTSHLSW